MKRTILIISGLVVLLVGGLLVAPSFISWESWRETAESRIKTATGFDAKINGGITLHLLPAPSLSVEEVRIGPPGMDEPILSFDRASVNVSLLPLFHGHVEVDSIRLVRPRIHLITLADGRQNWMTPEIDFLVKGNPPAAPDSAASAGLSDLVSLDHVGIEGGAFRYKNLQTGQEILVDSIDLTLRAESLSGPFALDGDLATNGLNVTIEGKTGRIDDMTAIPVDVVLGLPDRGATAHYAGIVSNGNDLEFQGETALSLKNPAETIDSFTGTQPAFSALEKPFASKGMMTFSKGDLTWKDLQISLGDSKFSGALAVRNVQGEPPEIMVDLAATSLIDLDSFLPAASEKQAKSSGKASAAGGFLPESIALPDGFRGQIKLSVPDASYAGRPMKGLSFVASRQDKPPSLIFEAAEIPGKTTIRGEARLKTEGKSPSLDVSVTAKAGYLPETLKFLLGAQDTALPAMGIFETGAADLSATITPARITLRDSTISLNAMTAGLKGFYARPESSAGRGQADIALNIDSLDADAISAKLNPPGAVSPDAVPAKQKNNIAKADIVAGLESLALPFDLTFDLGANRLIWQGQKMTGARLAGSLAGRTLALKTLGAENWYGTTVAVSGKVGNLDTLEGLDLSITGSAKNAQSILDALALNSDALPRPFGAADIAAKIEGDAKSIRFTTNLKALRGSAEASGELSDFLEKPDINALTVRISHPNFGDVLRMARKNQTTDRALDHPLDLYAKLERKDNSYTLSGLKANLGPTSLSGDLALAVGGARPALSGKIQAGTIPLDALIGTNPGETAASSRGQTNANAPDSVRWSRNAIDTGWMRALDVDLDMRATRLVYKGWDLSDPSFKIGLKDGILSIPDLKSGLFNGTLALSATVRSESDPRKPLALSGKAAIGDVGIEPVLHALTGATPLKASGNISLNTDIAASGVSMAALVFDLSGKGDLSGKDIVLEGVDLPRFARALSDETKPGDSLQGLWKGATAGGTTQFDSLKGNYTIDEGVINIRELLFDGPRAAINTTGAVNLPRWTVDLKNRITLKDGKELPPFDVSISGPLDNPGNTFGAGLMQDYFSRKLNRKIEKLIQDKIKLPGLGRGDANPAQAEPSGGNTETQGGEAQQAQPAPANALPKPEDIFKDVLRGLAR